VTSIPTQDRADEVPPRPVRVSRAAETAPGRTGASAPHPAGALARTPSPVTRAAPGRAAARGRGGAPELPGGGAPDTSVPPSGSSGRAYTIVLPAGLRLLSLNDRLHWAAANSIKQELKKAAWAMALHGKIPRLGRVFVAAVYQPPPDWRERDGDNPVISVKACIDGIVAAKVLPSDACPQYVTGVYCTIGEPFPAGRMVLHLLPSDPIRELAALAGLRGAT
jgi:hypothetical protein